MDGTVNHVKDAIVSIANRMRTAEHMPRERQQLLAELLSLIYSDDPCSAKAPGAPSMRARNDMAVLLGEKTRNDIADLIGDVRTALKDSRDPVKTARLYAALRRMEKL